MSRKPSQDQVNLMKSRGFLTIKEAAVKANVNQWSLYRWVRNGKVNCQNVAHNIYVDMKSLAKLIGPVMCEQAGLEYPEEDEDTPKCDTFLE